MDVTTATTTQPATETQAPATPPAAPSSPAPAAGETATVPEGAAAPATAKPEPKSDVFAKLSRQDRERQVLAKQVKDAQAKIAKAEADAKLAKENPLAFMEQNGITYAELTRRILAASAGKNEPESEVKTLADKVDELQKRQQERETADQQARLEAGRSTYLGKVKAHVQAQGAEFELVAKREAYDLVDEVTRAHWEQTGELLPIPEACQLVEAHLEEEAKAYLATEKVKRILAAPKPSDPPKDPQASPAAAPASKTLTNGQVARAGEAPPKTFKSDEEELAWLVKQHPVWRADKTAP